MDHKRSSSISSRRPPRACAEEFVPVLHSWIQQQAVPEHLLIDVADYAHVPGGPGTVLVAHEAHFYTDRGEDRLGLLYARRLPLPGGFTDKLRSCFRAVLEGCQRLENDPALQGRIKFRTDEAIFRISDRLAAPNNAQTFAKVKPELEKFLRDLYGGALIALQHNASPVGPFEVRIKATPAPDLKTLLTRLGSAAQPATV